MRKRIYRAQSVKTLDFAALTQRVRQAPRVVFGVDVAKTVMVACLKVEAESVVATLKWNHLEQTAQVLTWLASLPVRVEVALEPTGTYGDVLRWQSQRVGLAVFQVSPKKVHDSQELYDGVPSTHDGKAAALVGWLHWQGRSQPWTERCDRDRALAATVQTLSLYQVPFQRCLSRLEGQLARYWPELTERMELKSVTLLELLKTFGSPEAVAASARAAEELMHRIGRSSLHPQTIPAVLESARTTLGVPMVAAEILALQELATEARRLQQAIHRVETELRALSHSEELLERLGEVVGSVTAVVMTVYGGRVTAYPNAGSWEKALGLNLKIRSSGLHRGQLRLSKRGPSLVRKYLYLASLRWIRLDPVVRAWYEAKVQRQGGRLRKKAVVAVMRKLARALWWVGQGRAFSTRQLFDTRRLGLAS
ncbi:MAG: transposase [Acidobacteria bacterium]|nr:transposase [Acidobacteriota bacterium]